MKRCCCIMLSAMCLLLWLLPAGAQEAGRQQALRSALQQVESRDIQEEVYQLDPATGQLGAVFYTAPAKGYLEYPDYAYWYVAEGQAPQLLREGLDQPAPEDVYDDPRTYYRERSESFAHKGHGYFLLHLNTGRRQSDFTELYMMQPGGLKKLQSFGGAGYHPDAGFYQLKYEYSTEEWIEASLTPVIHFVSLKGDQLRSTAGLEIELHDLNQLQNGGELIETLTGGRFQPASLYYLPNNMVVVNFRQYDAAEEVTNLMLCFIGIEGGRGTMLNTQWNLEHPIAAEPFWQPVLRLSDALKDGICDPGSSGDDAIVPSAFLRPEAAQLKAYGLGAQEDTVALLRQQFDKAASGKASDQQLKAMAGIVDSADEEIRSLFLKVWGRYAIGLLDVQGADYFSGNGDDRNGDGKIGPGDAPPNSINVYLAEDEANRMGPFATFFHEVGHAVDANLGTRDDQPTVIASLMTQQFTADTADYDRVTLEEAARLDVSKHLRKFAEIYANDEQQADRVHMLIWSKYTEDMDVNDVDRKLALKLRAHYNLMFQDGGQVLSDIFGAATNNRIHLTQAEIASLNEDADNILMEIQYSGPYGHSAGDGYWYTVEQLERGYSYSRTLRMGPELFAGYFSARMRNSEKELRLIQNFLPNAAQLLKDNIRIMLMKAEDRGW